MCPRKRRWADRDITYVRLGYRSFQMFYEMSTSASKPKTMEDFIRSKYYEGFVKFGRSCVRNEYLVPEKFAEWLLHKGKKLDDWPKDKTYDEFLLEYVKKEPGMRAMERSVIFLAEWSKENDIPWQDYFRQVSGSRGVYDLRSGKISPWLLYISDSGKELLQRFSEEQIKMVGEIISATFWRGVFEKNPAEVREIQSICEASGI